MAKKFVRSITGIKNIQDQDLSTNNVGDLLSDGKDIYVHRKNGNKEEYFNITEEKKNPTDIKTPDGKGLTHWKEGDTTNVSLSEEFLTNNAQYLSSSDNSIIATPTQSQYGKNYDLKLSKELQDTIKNNTGSGKSKPIKITKDWNRNNLTLKETDDAITLGLSDNVLTTENFLRGGTQESQGLALVEDTYLETDDMGMNEKWRNVWSMQLSENYWLARKNLRVAEGSGLVYKDWSDMSTQFSTLDIDSTKLIRHDTLLGDEAKGIKVWHTDNQSTSSISLTDDVLAKLDKVDQLTSGEPVTPTTVSNTDGNLTVTTANNNAEVNFSDTAKTKLAKIDTIESNVTELTQQVADLQPHFESFNIENMRVTMFSIPYGGMGNHLAIITIETPRIDINNTNPVTIPRSHKVAKWLNNINLPSTGYIKSGSVYIKKSSNGGVDVMTDTNPDALKHRGVYQVVLSSL